jgi:polysaccharide pyruvyl transferase WcaK-like protein
MARLVLPNRLRSALRTLGEEGRHCFQAFQWLRSVNLLIFSGGGQLDDFWGGPLGHPWAILKWTMLARLRNARVSFVSVGFGTLSSRWSRLFARLGLALADYRSYRDSGSRELMRRAGFARWDPVLPDLAYSLDTGRPHRIASCPVRTVGICPIGYCDPRVWPRRDLAAYDSYVERLTRIVVWLLETQHWLVFFVSNCSDDCVIDDVIARALPRGGLARSAQISRPRTGSVEAFLDQAAAVDIVVASRLHAVLLSQLVCTPTIALSHDRKVDAHLATLGQEALRLNISTFQLPDFQQAFELLGKEGQAIQGQLRATACESGKLLKAQYDHVLAGELEQTWMHTRQVRRCGVQSSRLSAWLRHSTTRPTT